MYSVHDYGAMIADRVRMDAYAEALRQAVKPGSVVLDLGSGAGIFALLACRLGARHVYAIEPSDIIEVGREIAAANSYGDRITFLQQRSEQVSLPERVDVIVSDMRGVLPCLGGNLRALIDARLRFLAPGGTMIGRRDTVWAAVVEAPELFRRHFTGWEETTLGFDQQAARRIMANSWGKGRVPPEQFLTEPCRMGDRRLRDGGGPNFRAEMNWTAARAGTAHGLVVWFDAVLADGMGFSNAPGQPELIYGSAFFPWLEPVSLDAGDGVRVMLEARLMGEESYVWSWDSSISGRGKTPTEFRQTTLLGEAVSPETLKRRALQYRPTLAEDGQIDQFVLSAMNGRASLGTIARRLMGRFPSRFANLEAAMSRVGELSGSDTRARHRRVRSRTIGDFSRRMAPIVIRRWQRPGRAGRRKAGITQDRSAQSVSWNGRRGKSLKGARRNMVVSTGFGQRRRSAGRISAGCRSLAAMSRGAHDARPIVATRPARASAEGVERDRPAACARYVRREVDAQGRSRR